MKNLLKISKQGPEDNPTYQVISHPHIFVSRSSTAYASEVLVWTDTEDKILLPYGDKGELHNSSGATIRAKLSEIGADYVNLLS